MRVQCSCRVDTANARGSTSIVFGLRPLHDLDSIELKRRRTRQ
jgi:hypothetical protein